MADPFLDQLLAAAGMGDQEQALQAQMLQAQKLRDAARAPRNYTTPGAALGGGLSRLLDIRSAGKLDDQYKAGQAAIGDQRKALLAGLPDFADTPNVADVLTTDDPDLIDSRAAAVGSANQRRRVLARAFQATGDKTLAGVGSSLDSEASALEKQLDPGVLKLTLQQRKDVMEDKKLAQALELAGRHEEAATVRARMAANARIQSTPQYTYFPVDGGMAFGNKFRPEAGMVTIEGPDGQPMKGGKGSGGSKAYSDYQKFVYKASEIFASSRSVLGQDQATANRIQRAQILIDSKKDSFLTPQEVEDVTLALAGVLTGGSVAARTTIDNLSYNTLNMSVSRALQWLTSNPKDSKSQEFIKRISGILRNEYDGAKQRIAKGIAEPAVGLKGLLNHPDVRGDAKPFLTKIGLSPADLAEIFPDGVPPAADLNVGVHPVPAPGPAKPAPAKPAADPLGIR
jgi:hypothetical protein